MPGKNIVDENKDKMAKAVDHLSDELKGVRTGRASTGLVENLKVEYYGSPTPLKQLATMATPQADMIVIKPFDPVAIPEIVKTIKTSNLSLSPVQEGKIIRLNIPPLSEERRKQLVNQVKQDGEQAKVSIRNIRRDANKLLEKEQKDKIVTEDELDNGKKQIDEITKTYSEKVDAIVKAKSDDILID